MNINDIYQLAPKNITLDLYTLVSHIEDEIIQEISDYAGRFTPFNKKIETRILWRHEFDWTSYWLLASVWFENKPFGVLQNAGCHGLDYQKAFWTDSQVYSRAIYYLRSLIILESVSTVFDVIDVNFDDPELINFYGFKYGEGRYDSYP